MRRGLIGGTASTIVITMVVIGLTIGVYVIFKAPGLVQNELDIPEDFEPFADRTISRHIDLQAQDSVAAGYMTQALYSIDVDNGGQDVPLMEALRTYAYCRDKEPIKMCSDVPPESAIAEAIRSGMDDIVSFTGDGGRPYRVRVSVEDTSLFDIGGSGSDSTFAFLKPIPGGQHVRFRVGMRTGDFSMGVESE